MLETTRRILIALSAMLAVAAVASDARAQGYAVGPGEKLSVSVLGKPDLSGMVAVRENGTIMLHLLGAIDVAGDTVPQIEQKIVERAEDLFSGGISVVVGIAEYRDIYVLGSVEEPGAYPYRPGMNVMKALAVAGGLQGLTDDTADDRWLQDAQSRALEAQTHLRFAEADQAAIAAELARLDGADAAEGEPSSQPAGEGTPQDHLVDLRRALLERSLDGWEQKTSLANEEASLFAKRRDLIASQLKATEEQLESIGALVKRGLARTEQSLQLQVDADDFRSDELEAAAFEARARQTAVNAENEAQLAETGYHQQLLADKLAADERAEVARAELQASMEVLQQAGLVTPGLGSGFETIYEIYRAGGDAPERAQLTTPLGPEDVLMIRFEAVGQ